MLALSVPAPLGAILASPAPGGVPSLLQVPSERGAPRGYALTHQALGGRLADAAVGLARRRVFPRRPEPPGLGAAAVLPATSPQHPASPAAPQSSERP